MHPSGFVLLALWPIRLMPACVPYAALLQLILTKMHMPMSVLR